MRAHAVATSILLLFGTARGLPAFAADGGAAEPQLALQYDFFDVAGARVPDGSGNGNAGTLVSGVIVSGRRKPAVQLDGTGVVASDAAGHGLDLAGRAITVGAMCKPAAPDGVVASMGDATDGFSLYLKDGRPRFAVRSNGELREVADTEPLDLGQWVHLAGVIGANGELSLLVNAFPVAKGTDPSFLGRTPAGRFAVGADAGTPVGSHREALHWRGLLEDVRLYRGAVSRDAHRDLLGDWANRPGCGCRK
jgi:hypothetical protein